MQARVALWELQQPLKKLQQTSKCWNGWDVDGMWLALVLSPPQYHVASILGQEDVMVLPALSIRRKERVELPGDMPVCLMAALGLGSALPVSAPWWAQWLVPPTGQRPLAVAIAMACQMEAVHTPVYSWSRDNGTNYSKNTSLLYRNTLETLREITAFKSSSLSRVRNKRTCTDARGSPENT